MDKGIALYNDGWYGPAVARFRQAASVLPNSPYAHLWWGRAALAAGRPEEARLPLERAIALAPGTEVARKALLLLQQLNGSE
jgi:Flp pilus assembly protein TadD